MCEKILLFVCATIISGALHRNVRADHPDNPSDSLPPLVQYVDYPDVGRVIEGSDESESDSESYEDSGASRNHETIEFQSGSFEIPDVESDCEVNSHCRKKYKKRRAECIRQVCYVNKGGRTSRLTQRRPKTKPPKRSKKRERGPEAPTMKVYKLRKLRKASGMLNRLGQPKRKRYDKRLERSSSESYEESRDYSDNKYYRSRRRNRRNRHRENRNFDYDNSFRRSRYRQRNPRGRSHFY